MPDPMPEHRESPPQWPPLAAYDEPTAPPEPAEAELRATPTGVHPEAEVPPVAVPSQAGAPDESASMIDPRLSDRLPAPAPASETKTTPAAPDTHGRGVRMAIYGFGGAIVVGLIAVIVVMAGSGLVPGIGGDDDESSDRLMTDSGEVNEEQYARLAAAVGSEDWVKWRYGAAGDPEADAPSAKQPKTSELQIPGSQIERPYQHGDGSSPANLRNVQGQLGYVADDAGGKPPVDHVTTMETTDTTLGFTPRPGGRFTADAEDPDLNTKTFKECTGGDAGRVVAADRSHGAGYAAHSVAAFSSGVVATSGISGAQKGACVRLPAGQTPTSVAVTPGNEFALVTVWDTEKVRGRVAVIALADRPGTYGSSWPSTYPGLPNPGHFGFAKLLGFVDLKEIKAPTGITTGTDFDGSNVPRATADLSTEAGRQPFAEDVAKTGYAVVAATAEKRLEWIDLSPLLAGFHDAYFKGDPEVYAEPGTEAKQWPPTFETKPELLPKVATATKLDEAPMSVTALADTVYVGGGKGTLTTYRPDPEKPEQVGELGLEGPATCLVPTADGEQVLATSRRDRSISWLKPGETDPSVAQTLRDERIIDPICAIDNDDLTTADGTGTHGHTVSVADYGGGALHTFRYGEATMSDGSPVNLKENAYEYGGAYEPKGKPFAITTTADNI